MSSERVSVNLERRRQEAFDEYIGKIHPVLYILDYGLLHPDYVFQIPTLLCFLYFLINMYFFTLLFLHYYFTLLFSILNIKMILGC
jgi:hypothetical protein